MFGEEWDEGVFEYLLIFVIIYLDIEYMVSVFESDLCFKFCEVIG